MGLLEIDDIVFVVEDDKTCEELKLLGAVHYSIIFGHKN